MDNQRFATIAPALIAQATENKHRFEAFPWRYSVSMGVGRKRIVATCTQCQAAVELDVDTLELAQEDSTALRYMCLADIAPIT